MIKVRLWHYKLIPVLPNKMLVSQWRECLAIKRAWEKGTLNHRLVNYAFKDIDNISCFVRYTNRIIIELKKRNIKFNEKLKYEIWGIMTKEIYYFVDTKKDFKEHNDRYLKQCYYNLQEKADRGIVSKAEWQKIENLYKRR